MWRAKTVHLHSINPLDKANAYALVPGAERSVSVAGGCTVPHGCSERAFHSRVARRGCVGKGTSL